jgi:hypothetical protein
MNCHNVLYTVLKGNYFFSALQIPRLNATAAAAAVAKTPTQTAEQVTASTSTPVKHLRCKINENVCVIVLDTPGSKVSYRLL